MSMRRGRCRQSIAQDDVTMTQTVPDIEQLAKLADALPVNQINEFPSGSPKWWAEYHKVAIDIAKMTV